ncbi:MAG: hypothetical protein QOG06_2589 [Gaiellaceae bacterium]|nr:hypothetical protein [Gaiellaceae bacterium]
MRIYRADLAPGLGAVGGHRIVVIGYFGEPFLRLTRDGSYVNDSSLTAAGTGLAAPSSRKGGTTSWRLYSRTPKVIWHDARVRTLPPGTDRGRWTIPLLVDGNRARLEGKIQRVAAPPGWPWIAIGAVFAAATALLLARRRPQTLRLASAALGGGAALATLLVAGGLAAASTASEGTWVEAGNEIVLALAGLTFLLHGSRDARALAGGLLGLLALAVGLTKLPVFLHGVVLSAVPGNLTRFAVALAISARGAAAIAGVAVFFDVLEHFEEPASTQQSL